MAETVKFECRSGWHRLIQKAADEVATFSPSLGVRLVGGKEDNGGLSLSVAFDDMAASDAVESLIADYRNRSLSVCEECGRRGRLHQGKARCESHSIPCF